MKHLKVGRKFSRIKKQREALLRIMLGDLLLKGKMTTTLAKAKELKMIGEKMISRIKDPQKIRLVKSKLPRNIDVKKIREIAKKTASRRSGYLRITKKGPRRSDGAPLAIIEIIEDAAKEEKSAGNKTASNKKQ
jgi:large subunit ribosomal protein L17